jgi:hypothetical protein
VLLLNAAGLFFATLLLFTSALCLGLCALLIHDALICRAFCRENASPVCLWLRWRRCGHLHDYWRRRRRWCRRWRSSSSFSSSHGLVLLSVGCLLVSS